MALTDYRSKLRKDVHTKLSLDEIYAVRKKQSLADRKRFCAYCTKKCHMPTTSGSSWLSVGDRTHGFFCTESCAAMWAVEQLTQALEKDDWRITVE